MKAIRHRTSSRQGWSILRGLLLTVTVLAPVLWPPAPAVTAAEPPKPIARLQLIVDEITIHDDREGFLSGIGEMVLSVYIYGCRAGYRLPCGLIISARTGGANASERFNSSSGDTVRLDRLIPQDGDNMAPGNASDALGLAVFADQPYVVEFDMFEHDGPGNPDKMGHVTFIGNTAEHGLRLGTHTVRSVREDGTTPGDYTVTFQVRATPQLPDLRPSGFTVHDIPGSTKKLVCVGIQNVESGDATQFDLTIHVDGAATPVGRAHAGRLAAGSGGKLCADAELPATGEHLLSAVVDGADDVAEYNEANNVYSEPYVAPRAASDPDPSPSATPTPPVATPTVALSDLTVSAIRVNGRAPDGKDDCEDGKNTVTVVVKNAGIADVRNSSLSVLLAVDGDDVGEESVSGLKAGQERDVRFGDVRLKKGEHTLTATVDPKGAFAESDEGNNTLKVTARCKDDE